MRHSTFKDEVEINYVLNKASNKSDVLVVSFPGAGGDRFRPGVLGLGYMMTIGQHNVNALYIKNERRDFVRAYLAGDGEDFSIERTMIKLVDFACKETGATRCIGIGSSLGGNTALYYGLKYNWDIIAGGAQARPKSTVGRLIRSMIPTAKERGFDKQVYMCWGRGEPMWQNPRQAPSLVKIFEESKLPYKMELFEYSVHANISRQFPHIIKRELGALLGGAPASEKPGKAEPGVMEISAEIHATIKGLEPFIPDLEQVTPNLSIRGRLNRGARSASVMLETFVYASQNYHWLPKATTPTHHEPDRFWQTVAPKDREYAHSMWFQATVLNHYKATGDVAALKLVADSLAEFFPLSPFLREADKSGRSYNNWPIARARAEFLIDFACTVHECKADPGLAQKIAWDWLQAEITEAVKICVRTEALLENNDPRRSYGRSYFLLLAASFFKENEAFRREAYARAIAAAVAVVDHQFDDRGICIAEQVRMQHTMLPYIRSIVEFAEANDFEPDPNFRKLKRKLSAIRAATRHLTSPDGFMPNIGHTDLAKTYTRPSAGNFIKTSSNIAILSDSGAYITIGGGSNVHSSFRHCDLLSFTFRYDGQQLVWDAGGGHDGLADYARSAVAHSALFCDEIDYITPDYGDWTVLDDAVETDEYVFISGQHKLIEGVTLWRKWLWLKPNIIVIYDEGRSESEHLYTQNLLLPKVKFDATNEHEVTFAVAKGYTFKVTQLPTGRDFELKKFFGTTDAAAPEKDLRGSRLFKYRKPVPLTNLAYEKRAKRARFITVLEAHSGRDGELTFGSANVADRMLNVTASAGEKTVSVSERLKFRRAADD